MKKDTPEKPPLRETQVLFYMTEADASELQEMSEAFGFKSRSRMLTAIVERLVAGGMSGISFVKVGWQMSGLIEESHKRRGTQAKMYFDLRPFPPLIGETEEPTKKEIIPFLNDLEKQMRKEKAA